MTPHQLNIKSKSMYFIIQQCHMNTYIIVALHWYTKQNWCTKKNPRKDSPHLYMTCSGGVSDVINKTHQGWNVNFSKSVTAKVLMGPFKC